MHHIVAADALGHADTTGSIEVGKFADFIVLDQNIIEIEPGDIDSSTVQLTVLGGTEVHRHPNF